MEAEGEQYKHGSPFSSSSLSSGHTVSGRPLPPVSRTDDSIATTMWYLSLPEACEVKINGETSPAGLEKNGWFEYTD